MSPDKNKKFKDIPKSKQGTQYYFVFTTQIYQI